MSNQQINGITEHLALPYSGLSAKQAKRVVQADLSQDQNPQNNLASFVCTEMEPEAEELLLNGMKKNFIDSDQYKGSNMIEQKCVSMIAKLWNCPGEPCGTSCLGSSEAIMLAGLSMRAKWRQWRRENGKDIERPNIVCGSNVQVCWHKMCSYFDIECREADVSCDALVLTAERARPLIDENTIGVCPILGSTFNGEYEDIKAIHDMVVEVNTENGWHVPLHVDAASGGFIAPFLNPTLEWDFRLPNVKSINASGHKFGLTYAGLGWLMFRERESDLPAELVYTVGYLGGCQASITLNFSKSASTILAQYYNFMRLGWQGYRQVMEDCMDIAQYLRQKLCSTPTLQRRLHIVDKQHMPLVAWSLSEEQMERCSVFELQEWLERKGGWSVPAYQCSSGAENMKIMRVVVKNSFSMVLCDLLLKDIEAAFIHFDQRFESKCRHETSSLGDVCGNSLAVRRIDEIINSTNMQTITAELLLSLAGHSVSSSSSASQPVAGEQKRRTTGSEELVGDHHGRRSVSLALSIDRSTILASTAFATMRHLGLMFAFLASCLFWAGDKAQALQHFCESTRCNEADTVSSEERSISSKLEKTPTKDDVSRKGKTSSCKSSSSNFARSTVCPSNCTSSNTLKTTDDDDSDDGLF